MLSKNLEAKSLQSVVFMEFDALALVGLKIT